MVDIIVGIGFSGMVAISIIIGISIAWIAIMLLNCQYVSKWLKSQERRFYQWKNNGLRKNQTR
jgi:hypothetical protein